MNNEFSKPGEDFIKSASDYVDLKIDDLKLRTAKGLSLTISRLLSMILMLSVVSIVLMALAFGSVLFLGDIIGSYGLACLIVAAFFLIVLAILFVLRKKLFVNGFVKLFINLFFNEDDKEI